MFKERSSQYQEFKHDFSASGSHRLSSWCWPGLWSPGKAQLGKDLLPGWLRLLAEFSSLWLWHADSVSCRVSVGGHHRLLEVVRSALTPGPPPPRTGQLASAEPAREGESLQLDRRHSLRLIIMYTVSAKSYHLCHSLSVQSQVPKGRKL